MTESIPHILVIDDNEGILESVEIILRLNRMRVSINNGKAGCYSLLSELQPDLVLLDKCLAGSDGCEICAWIKADRNLSATSVIMFSAFHNIAGVCLAAGADAFLAKPFDLQELLRLVRLYTGPGCVAS